MQEGRKPCFLTNSEEWRSNNQDQHCSLFCGSNQHLLTENKIQHKYQLLMLDLWQDVGWRRGIPEVCGIWGHTSTNAPPAWRGRPVCLLPHPEGVLKAGEAMCGKKKKKSFPQLSEERFMWKRRRRTALRSEWWWGKTTEGRRGQFLLPLFVWRLEAFPTLPFPGMPWGWSSARLSCSIDRPILLLLTCWAG